MPTLTPAQFRSDFPEFANPVMFTDGLITSWITTVGYLLNAQKWGGLLTIGTELLVAHNITLSARDQAAALAGGAPGEMTGAVSGKGVDKVNVSFDTNAAALKNAGDYALTSYGIRYFRLAHMIGAGGSQL
jgi:Protein of unknown function (DUF4054)